MNFTQHDVITMHYREVVMGFANTGFDPPPPPPPLFGTAGHPLIRSQKNIFLHWFRHLKQGCVLGCIQCDDFSDFLFITSAATVFQKLTSSFQGRRNQLKLSDF